MPSAARHTGGSPEPSPWIVRFASLIPFSGRVLDLACGTGRHACFLAGLGMSVLAIDRDAAVLAALRGVPGVTTAVVDLEQGGAPIPPERFAGIVVTHYLHRPLLPMILAALAPDGALLYETFATGQERHGRPANPDYLLRPGELLQVCCGPLRVVAFEQGEEAHAGGRRVVQRIVAVGPARAWPPALPPARDAAQAGAAGGGLAQGGLG